MSWQYATERWRQKVLLKSGIAVCKRVLWLEQHLHHKELIAMANLAETLLPILEKELYDIRNY